MKLPITKTHRRSKKLPSQDTLKGVRSLVKERAFLVGKTLALLLILITGVGAALLLTQISQDLRQQASTGVYAPDSPSAVCTPQENLSCSGGCNPVTGKCRIASPTPNNPSASATVDPFTFAEVADEENTEDFVVTPEELGYDPETSVVHENVTFGPEHENNPDLVWIRGYEWSDTETSNEYHSTVTGYTNENAAETAYKNGPIKRTQGVTTLDTSNIALPGVNDNDVHIFQASDPAHTVNFSFQVGEYFIVLKAKNVEDLELALENLETMAEVIITDLQQN